MTFDRSIELSCDWDRQSRRKMSRLWLALADLSESELSEFICDLKPYIDIEYFNEIETGFSSYVFDGTAHLFEERSAHDPDSFFRLDTIDTSNVDDMLGRRKKAFLRIWDSFDVSTKTSFFQRVLGLNVTSTQARRS